MYLRQRQSTVFGPGGGSSHPGNQRGAVLIVALIFLVLLTILALSASSSSILQLRMAGNLRNAQQAMMSANTAVRGAEWQLWRAARAPGDPITCTGTLSASSDGCIIYDPTSPAYASGGVVTKFRQNAGWLASSGTVYQGPNSQGYTSGATPTTAQLAQDPRYIIERLGRVRPPGASIQQEYRNPGAPSGPELYLYRITARATGASDNSIRVVQSTFAALGNSN